MDTHVHESNPDRDVRIMHYSHHGQLPQLPGQYASGAYSFDSLALGGYPGQDQVTRQGDVPRISQRCVEERTHMIRDMKIVLGRQVRRACRLSGFDQQAVAQTIAMPDRYAFDTPGRFKAMRKLDDRRVLVVQCQERWSSRQRIRLATRVWTVEENSPATR